MNHIQRKYNLLHIFFWLTYCTIYGYVAVFLQYKGLSSTMIGLTTGLGSALTILTTPWLSGMAGRIRGLSIKRLIVITYIGTIALWMVLLWVPLPQMVLMACYIAMTNLIAANVPLLTMICMNYLTDGVQVNFGIARGLGSVAYASSAVILGILIEHWNPSVLGVVHAIGTAGLFAIVYSLPDVAHKEHGSGQESISIPEFARRYSLYVLILLAFALQFSAATTLSTYLIDIVVNLGGTTSMYGIAVFFMAASELPFMALTPWLKRYLSSERLLLFAALMYMLRNVTIALAPNLTVLIIGMLLQGCSYGIFTASITYYVHEQIGIEHGMAGQTMIAVMTTGLGATVGNVLGGMLQDGYGLPVMLRFTEWITAAGFLLYAVLMLKEALTKASSRKRGDQ